MESGNVHNVILESRKKISVSGVEDIESFDENGVSLYTVMGNMEIKGKNIHMTKLNLESGEITAEGEFDSISYPESAEKNVKKGMLAGLFK